MPNIMNLRHSARLSVKKWVKIEPASDDPPSPRKSRRYSTRQNFPKKSVRGLKDWLKQHKFNPYPTENDKKELSERLGITFRQVSNWFINARRRSALINILKEDGLTPEDVTVRGAGKQSEHREYSYYCQLAAEKMKMKNTEPEAEQTDGNPVQKKDPRSIHAGKAQEAEENMETERISAPADQNNNEEKITRETSSDILDKIYALQVNELNYLFILAEVALMQKPLEIRKELNDFY